MEVVTKFLEARDAGDEAEVQNITNETLIALKTAAQKLGNQNPPDKIWLTLTNMCKQYPEAFRHPRATNLLLEFINPEFTTGLPKSMANPAWLPILACNILMGSYVSEKAWPIEFVKMYVEDSLKHRTWVDSEQARRVYPQVHTHVYT